MKRITEETKEQVVKLFQEGCYEYKIAALCNISEWSVNRILVEKKLLPEKRREVSADAVDRAVKLYEEGERVLDILDQCDIPYGLLYKTLDDRKVGRRKIIAQKQREKPFEKEILALYKQNLSYNEISKELLWSDSYIRKCIKSALEAGEIEVSERYKMKKEEKEFLMDLAKFITRHNRRVPVCKVADFYNVDRKQLYNYIEKLKRK